MHYDHVGNVERFPNATFSIAREEYDFWCGPHAELMTALVDPEEMRIVRRLAHEERLHLVDGAEELFPGLSVTRLGGHTPGQLMVRVDSDAGVVVLASDAAHYYEELEHNTPSRPTPPEPNGSTTPSSANSQLCSGLMAASAATIWPAPQPPPSTTSPHATRPPRSPITTSRAKPS